MGRDDRLVEKKIDGKSIYQGNILDLEVDRVLLPSGSEASREVVRHKGAVVVLPLHEDRKIEFVRQYRYPMGEILLELPAGKLDPGEEPVECAARELAEETGWKPTEIHELGSFFTTPASPTRCCTLSSPPRSSRRPTSPRTPTRRSITSR